MLDLRVVILVVLAILTGAIVSHAAVAPNKMTIAYASIGPRSAPLWAADEYGIFRKYGIEPQVIFVRGAPTLVAALTSGDMDIGYTGGTAVLGASAAGIDLKILAVLTNRVTYDLVARPASRAPKICAANASASPASAARCGWAACSAWKNWASTPTATISSFLVSATRWCSVKRWKITASTPRCSISFSASGLPKRDFRFWPNCTRPICRSPPRAWSRARLYPERIPQLMENFIKSVMEGIAFVLGPANKAATIKLLQRRLHVTEREAEEGFVDMLIGMDKKPIPSMDGLRNIQRLMKLRNPKLAGTSSWKI